MNEYKFYAFYFSILSSFSLQMKCFSQGPFYFIFIMESSCIRIQNQKAEKRFEWQKIVDEEIDDESQ